MKNFEKLILVIMGSIIVSCDNDVSPKDVLQIKTTKTELRADGSSTAKISGYIPIAALPDKRTVTFKVSSGTLEDSLANAQVKKISLKAEKQEGDFWVASTDYTAGVDVGKSVIYASIEGVVDSVTISLMPAAATGIKLTADAFAVPVNFLGEINLTAILTSSSGKVSKGQKVRFVDTYENGTPLGGSFRNVQSTSDDNSQVRATYSPGVVPPNVYMFIKAIVLDEQGGDTNITSEAKIYLKPE